MGRAKGDLVVSGISLAERAARSLWPVSASVLISLAPGTENPAHGFPAVEDEPPAGRGPLAGISAAFRATGSADLLVLACDYPYVETALLAALVAAGGDDDLVMPTDPGGRDHPLVALWKRCTETHVRRALAERAYKVRGLLADLRVRRLYPAELPGIDLARALSNWNTPEDL